MGLKDYVMLVESEATFHHEFPRMLITEQDSLPLFSMNSDDYSHSVESAFNYKQIVSSNIPLQYLVSFSSRDRLSSLFLLADNYIGIRPFYYSLSNLEGGDFESLILDGDLSNLHTFVSNVFVLNPSDYGIESFEGISKCSKSYSDFSSD